MSKTAKQIILFLIILSAAAVGFAGFLATQKQSVENQKLVIERELESANKRANEYLVNNKTLQDKMKQIEEARNALEAELNKYEGVDIDALKENVEDLTKKAEDWKTRFETVQKERDDLTVKLQEKPKEVIVYKEKESAEPPPAAVSMPEGDTYWAQIIKEKAALELEIENLRKDLTQNSVDLVEIKKQNSDLQLELSNLSNAKETIARQIKHGNDLADSLSLELARAKNDKQFFADRIEKMNEENVNLKEQIKQLTSTKIALEKSIVRIQEEKKDVEKKLLQTENVIQSRIDEIWEIKDTLDKGFNEVKSKRTGEIELPPIIVSSEDAVSGAGIPSGMNGVGFSGNIVSVNDENNFVIVDIGETKGISIGEKLNVYRGADYIAGLEVIQVRKDIAAADIKSKVAPIQVGDVVR